MSLLYPRLMPNIAKVLHADYKKMTIDELGLQAKSQHDSAVFVATGGARVSPDKLLEVRNIVLKLATTAGFPEKPSADAKNTFDLSVARYLHSELEMVPAEAAAGDIWAFLSLVVLPDVSYWRFLDPPGDRVLASDMTRHVFGRLWWRAQLVYESNKSDPYSSIDQIGGEAFGQIYERRASLGASPLVVRNILKVWSELDPSSQKRSVLRDFLKRLLRLRAFVAFEAQSEDGLTQTMRSALQESIDALLPGRTPAKTLAPDENEIVQVSYHHDRVAVCLAPPPSEP
ncbi:DUF6339 family protein [Rhodococcus sp. OK302]|uniref:DUF6339 family protein n=1 Tax=Rhodococcus sp. OK302 TaxID=1882769 RepID=UPI000B9F72DD|nr:DUF6339 family protein [Rhodococcus sp. OK302]OYD71393.1 hypothetical protein BDB13_5064 [Rhodococcus sp. OK302]